MNIIIKFIITKIIQDITYHINQYLYIIILKYLNIDSMLFKLNFDMIS